MVSRTIVGVPSTALNIGICGAIWQETVTPQAFVSLLQVRRCLVPRRNA
jgi:hypothetical protein